MSDVAIPTTGASAAADFLKQNQVTPTTGGGIPYLRFDARRTGEWLIGAAAEVCTGEEFALDVATLKHGQILWHNKKAKRTMVPINQPLPEPPEPVYWTDPKGVEQVDEASEARSFEGVFEDGTRFEMESSTFGGRKAVDNLLAQLFTRAQANSVYLFPVVRLTAGSYEHQSYGKVFEPILEPVAWYDDAGNQEPAQDARLEAAPEAKAEPEPEPQAEPEAEPQTAEAAPRRRRRRAG